VDGLLDIGSSLGVLVLNLGESLLDHLLEFGDELELLSSGGGGEVVLVGEGVAEGGGLVPELLVSLLLVGGLGGDGGLGSDALVESVELVLESLLLGGESVEVVLESLVLLVEGFDGGSIELLELSLGGLDVASEVIEELGDTLEGGLVELSLLGGELGEGGEDGGIGGESLELNGVLDHLLGDLAHLSEGTGAGEDGGEDVGGLVDGLEGILVLLGSLVGIGLLSLSLGLDDSLVLLVGEGVLLVLLVGILDSDLLGVAAVELVAGVSEDVGGVSDLLLSELVLGGALGGLGVVDLVVVDLLGVDGVSELSQDVEDGIEGGV